MHDVSGSNPHKEEDEGYLAAEAGLSLARNPYPRGTIRYEKWVRGWQIKLEETRGERATVTSPPKRGRPFRKSPSARDNSLR